MTFCPIGLVFWENDGSTKFCEFWQPSNDGVEITSRELGNEATVLDYNLVDGRYLSVVYSKLTDEKIVVHAKSYIADICAFIGEYLSELRQTLQGDNEADPQDDDDISPLSCRRQHLLGNMYSRISSIEEVMDHLENSALRNETTYNWLLKTNTDEINKENQMSSNIDQSLLTQVLTNITSSPRKQQFQEKCAKEFFVPSHKSDKMFDNSKSMVTQLSDINLLCDFIEKELGLLSEQDILESQIDVRHFQIELRWFREAIRSLSIALNRTLDAVNEELVSAYAMGVQQKNKTTENQQQTMRDKPRNSATLTISSPNGTNIKNVNMCFTETAETERNRSRPKLRATVSDIPAKKKQTDKMPRLSVELLRDRDGNSWENRSGSSVCSESKEWQFNLSECGSSPGSPVRSVASNLSINTIEKTYKQKYECLKEDMKGKDALIRNLKKENKRYREEKNTALNELKVLNNKFDGLRRNEGIKKKKKSATNGSANGNEAEMDEDEMYAMLQRMKKENKELRKSRNTLQSDNSLFAKIEGKLRYKLEMLMKKLSNFQNDLPPNIHKKLIGSSSNGSIEEAIDVLIEHVTWVNDRQAALENELKLKSDNTLNNFCQDLKQFALNHNLLRKDALQDVEWMPGQQKLATQTGDQNPSWQTLFKHMSVALQAEKLPCKEVLEWIKTNAKEFCDNNKDNLMDCVTHVMKSMQNEQMQLKSTNERIEKEKQELSDEMKELKSLLSKEEQRHTQMMQMESEVNVLRQEKAEAMDVIKIMKDQLDIANAKINEVIKEYDESIQKLRAETDQIKNDMQETQSKNEELKNEIAIITKKKEKTERMLEEISTEKNKFQEELLLLKQEREELKKELKEILLKANKINTSIGAQTDTMDVSGMINEEFVNQMKCLMDENAELLNEINRLIQEKSRLNYCNEAHKGEVLCMLTSPKEYLVCTGGNDYTVRLWKPNTANNTTSTSAFEPYACALVEGRILSLAITRDGQRIACGCSVRDTPNGYVVVWDVSTREVLCNLRSRPTQRFGKVSAIAFGNDSWIFAGDITGQIYVYDVNTQQQIAHIHGHKDVIYRLRILANNVMISVSHDQWLGHFDLTQLNSTILGAGVKTGVVIKKRHTYDSKQLATSLSQAKLCGKNVRIGNAADLKHFQIEFLFKDEKYPLLTGDFYDAKNVITGSRKLIMVPLLPKSKNSNDEKEKANSKESKALQAKCFGNDKDLDIIHLISTYQDKYVMVHRANLDYVKVFSSVDGSLVCKCDVTQNNINAIDYSYDGRYVIVCLSVNSLNVGCLVVFPIA